MADANFNNVVLLTHFDDVVAVEDASNSMHPGSLNTLAALSPVQSKFGGRSLLASTTPASTGGATFTNTLTDFNFGAGQFTVEGWLYWTTLPTSVQISAMVAQWGTNNRGWQLGWANSNVAFYYSTTGSDALNVGTAWAPVVNTWYHVAADRDASNVLRVYTNGTVRSSATVTATLFASTRTLVVGNDEYATHCVCGYVDEVRITKGLARYAGAFTAPTLPFDNSSVQAHGRVSQVAFEALQRGPSSARVSQVAFETLRRGGLTSARTSQVAFEVLRTVAVAPPTPPRLVLAQ